MIISKELNVYCDIIKRMGTDKRVLATHVSLFTSLFIFWQRDGFVSPFAITRKTVMAFSNITSASGNWMSMATSVISHLFTLQKAA